MSDLKTSEDYSLEDYLVEQEDNGNLLNVNLSSGRKEEFAEQPDIQAPSEDALKTLVKDSPTTCCWCLSFAEW